MAEFLEKSCKISGNIVKMNLIEETKGFLLDYFGFLPKEPNITDFIDKTFNFPVKNFSVWNLQL